ncbi:MAG: PAS domain-containing sensor histidine kinase [Desulfobacteraceae bacterium]|nr:MAG: PAS domain-containing sensor histidine kinase [Desulfobacteraceae bacterium]
MEGYSVADSLSCEELSLRVQKLEKERRELETFRESHQKLATILQNAPFLVIAVDRQWRVQEANRAAFSLMGYLEPGEILGSRCGKAIGCIHHVDDPRGCGYGPACGTCVFRLAILETFESGKSAERIESRHRIIGDTVPERTFLVTTARPEGNNHVIVFIEDVTEQRKAEEEKKRLQAQLGEAKKMEAVGRLAGGVAHDFNNMLGVIIGNAEMAMLQINPGEPLNRYLQAILKAGNRSAETVRQLLAFAGEQRINPEVLDLNDMVAGMLNTLRSLTGPDVDLSILQCRDLWKVKMDPSQVNQIVAALVLNARDAIAGKGKVTIETANVSFDERTCQENPDSLPGEFVLLSISDTGSGMGQEVLEHLFEPFFTTKEFGGGPGLGLSTVYGIVKQNNGFIGVDSEPGKGTTFRVYIKRSEENANKDEFYTSQLETRRGTETILLVDDEQEILRTLKPMLVSLGYRVFAAESASAAMKIAEEHTDTIHLLISDVEMPDVSGKMLAKNLKLLYPGLKCLFMSGYTSSGVAFFGMLEDGEEFIHKPFSMSDLAGKVRKVLM